MALNTTLPINYDSVTYEAWSDLFGPTLSLMIENRVKAIVQKYPGRARDITIRFAGDIDGITVDDVKSRTACVATNSLIEGKQTFRGWFSKLIKKLFRREGHFKPDSQKIQPIIVCTVIVVAPEETTKVDNVG